jgi:hypothetical protein
MANQQAMINRAAQWLGVRRLGQALQADHQARIAAAYAEVYDQLKNEGLAVWASDGEVPDKIVASVAALMAWNCLDTYKVSADLYQRIVNATGGEEGEIAKAKIRKYTTTPYTSTDSPTDF